MMPIYSYNLVLMVVCAVVFYRAGAADESPALLWSALSIIVSAVIWLGLGWGFLAMVLAQVALFFGIAIVRVLRESQ
jgi:hypothetical protein